MARRLASVKIDLFAHHGHGFVMALTLRITNTMHFNKVPAKAGYLWFEQGLQLFWKNLAIFLIGSLCYSLLMMPLSAMPMLLSHILPQLLFPLISICFMTVCRNTLKLEPTAPAALFNSLRLTFSKATVWRLLLLGLYYTLALLIMFAASALVDNGLLVRLALSPSSLKPEMLESGRLTLSILVMAAIYIPVSMLFWFAPALSAWHQVPLRKTLFFSMVVCWRNLSAFMLNGLVLAGFGVTLFGALILLFKLGGIEQTPQMLAFIVSIIVMPISFCAHYASYVGCFSKEPRHPPSVSHQETNFK